MSDPDPKTVITEHQIRTYQDHFTTNPKNELALNAVTTTPVQSVALNHKIVTETDHTFSILIHNNEITSQERSGRCWMFAGLNTFRVEAMKNLNLEKFELSQNYPLFWDKLEKSNYFLETILKTLDEPINGRMMMFLLQSPIQDGGQWDMFVNLIKKYGVVPKTVMPETDSSKNTRVMVLLLTSRLREFAAELRRMHAQRTRMDYMRQRKSEMLDEIYRMLAIHLGEPPKEFLWQWRDKDDTFHRDGLITPRGFFNRYVKVDLDSMVCLMNCPTEDKPYNKVYTIQYLGNVIEGEIIRYLNVDLSIFKKAAVDTLKSGEPVWFGCDVGKNLERDLGILDASLYDYELVYGSPFRADKAQRVDYGDSMMSHAMVFTGVDLGENGAPKKWRVENSWGDKIGDKGYLVMNDAWFDEYMYEVVVPRKFISPELLAVLQEEPVVLPPWDPMGALAAAE